MTELRLEEGYLPLIKSVRGEKARNGRDFFDASTVVGVVVPLAEGEPPSVGNSAVDVALGVVELGSTGESGRDDRSKSDSRDTELEIGRESLHTCERRI